VHVGILLGFFCIHTGTTLGALHTGWRPPKGLSLRLLPRAGSRAVAGSRQRWL